MNRRVNLALFGLGFALAIAFLPGTVDAALTLRWVVLAIGVPLLLLLSGRNVAPFPWLPGAFVALAALSLGWTTDFLGGVDELAHLVILLAAFWLGASLTNATHLWTGLSAGVAVSAAIAMAEVLGVISVPQAATDAPAGLLGNPNFLAEAGAVALITSLAIKSWPARILAVAALVAVLLGGSKAVFAALSVAFAFWLAPRRPWAAWGVLGSVALLAVVLFAGGKAPSAEARLDIWAPALADLRLFGHGLSSFSGEWPVAGYAHSEPVQLAYEFGVLALLPALIFWKAIEGWCGETEGFLLVALGTLALVAFPLHLPVSGFAAAVAAGRLSGARHRLERRRLDGRLAIGVGV